MTILKKRFIKLESVLNKRMCDLTVLIDNINKPHNLSAIIRSCDAVGVLEAYAVNKNGNINTFNSTAQGSQKWVNINNFDKINDAIKILKEKNFKLFGTNLNNKSIDYRDCDFKGPTAFVMGAEKWGLEDSTLELLDQTVHIPMRGMVQSLNVSVATANLLFEALRQRHKAGILPSNGEGMSIEKYKKTLFEWAYPEIAFMYKQKNINYPELDKNGEIIGNISRAIKVKN